LDKIVDNAVNGRLVLGHHFGLEVFHKLLFLGFCQVVATLDTSASLPDIIIQASLVFRDSALALVNKGLENESE